MPTSAPAAPANLPTRKPTGRVPWPFILLEGEEKAGKTWTAALFSASERVGQTYWLDLGEGAGDEYGALPGVRYLVVEHDGSYRQILDRVRAIYAEAERAAAAGEPPVVVVVDTGSALWSGIKDGVTAMARARMAKKRNIPVERLDVLDDEIRVTSDLWNVADSRWRAVMSLLLRFPGIAIMTARGKWIAEIGPNGQPVEGKKVWKVDGEKNLAYDATAVVRMTRGSGAALVGARSVRFGVRPGVDDAIPMGKEWDEHGLEWFIFDALGIDPQTAHARDLKDVDATAPDSPAPVGESQAEVVALKKEALLLRTANGYGGDPKLIPDHFVELTGLAKDQLQTKEGVQKYVEALRQDIEKRKNEQSEQVPA